MHSHSYIINTKYTYIHTYLRKNMYTHPVILLTEKLNKFISSISKVMEYFKGCVHYIFASLFCMCKRTHFRNKEQYFSFHFESSFCSWDNQVLAFQTFKYPDVIKCLSMKLEPHLLTNFGSIKNLYENVAWKLVSSNFFVLKECSVKRNLRRSVCSFGQILTVLLWHI